MLWVHPYDDPKVIAAYLGVEEDEVDPTLGETR